MGNGVVASQAESTLEQSKKPSNAIWPARLVDELSEDELSRSEVGRRAGQDGDADDCKTTNRPDKCGSVDIGQQAVHEGVDDKGNEGPGYVD